MAIGYTLVGRLSDIFGRRYFFIGGALLGLVGSIIAATAQKVDVLIGANVFIGFAASSQISFTYVTGELVPVRHRFIINGLINAVNIPIGVFGPVIARSFVLHTSAGWRWNYYLTIILSMLNCRNMFSMLLIKFRCLVLDMLGSILFPSKLLASSPCAFSLARSQKHRLCWRDSILWRPVVVPDGPIMGWNSISLEVCSRYSYSRGWFLYVDWLYPLW